MDRSSFRDHHDRQDAGESTYHIPSCTGSDLAPDSHKRLQADLSSPSHLREYVASLDPARQRHLVDDF